VKQFIQHLASIENRLLGWRKHCVETPQDAHREDDIGVSPAPEKVAKDIIGDSPDEGDGFVVGGLVH
jgi:hypothetical protein